jgi:hypothetical protein
MHVCGIRVSGTIIHLSCTSTGKLNVGLLRNQRRVRPPRASASAEVPENGEARLLLVLLVLLLLLLRERAERKSTTNNEIQKRAAAVGTCNAKTKVKTKTAADHAKTDNKVMAN